MYIKSQRGCKLFIGNYPSFNYDASGGGGHASCFTSQNSSLVRVHFDPDKFSIPPLSWRTARFLGLPLLPCLIIRMRMEKLGGYINKVNGEVSLDFVAKFFFKIWPIYSFPALIVSTNLITGKLATDINNLQGMPINKKGRSKLVGSALIQPTSNKLLNAFLGLPNKAIAVLECEFKDIDF